MTKKYQVPDNRPQDTNSGWEQCTKESIPPQAVAMMLLMAGMEE